MGELEEYQIMHYSYFDDHCAPEICINCYCRDDFAAGGTIYIHKVQSYKSKFASNT